MEIIDELWMVLLNFLTHPASRGIAVAVIGLMSAMIALRVLPELVAESDALPSGTMTATILRVAIVLAGTAVLVAAAAGLIIALPRP